ncbi:MAG: phosphatase PAP2 family protein [Janthinobacterium lividum]
MATLALLTAVLLWDASHLDLVIARLAGSQAGFALRENHLVILVMHEIPRFASTAGVVALFLLAIRPLGFFRRLERRDRFQLAGTVLASVIAVSLVKNVSHTSCPWELQEFGGVARYVSHWAWGVNDGGTGRCFPAGHASAAFAWVGGWFVLRRYAPRGAAAWLGVAVALGFVLGLGQQWRGAHYMSHTLWTGWICWTVGLAIDMAMTRLFLRHGPT